MYKKRVFITGGSRGIGLAISKRYQKACFDVIVPSRKELDLASVKSLDQYCERYGQIKADVLINNAGVNIIKLIPDMGLKDWQLMLDINLTMPFLLMNRATPYMIEKGWGRIVNISSIYSLISREGRVGYSASKAGLNALTRTAALEYGENSILVNAICPGFIETDMTRQNNSPEEIDALRNQVPLRRLGTPQEVAELVFSLGSEQNTYVTGQTFIIDGGYLAK